MEKTTTMRVLNQKSRSRTDLRDPIFLFWDIAGYPQKS